MYTPEQLNNLIAEVEKEFAPILAKAEKSFGLSKADSNDQPKDKKVNGAADDKKNSAKDEKTSFSENKEGGKSDDHRNEAADEKQENGDAKKEASQDKSGNPIEGEKEGDRGADDQHQQQAGAKEGQADEDHGYDDEDMGHMHSMYSSMSRGELKAHHDAVRKAMDGHGLAKCEDGMSKAEMLDAAKDAEGYRPNGGPKDGEAAKAKTPAAGGAQALEKSEKDIVIAEVSLLKSELETVKAENEKSKKEVEAVTAFLAKFVEKTVPAGKAIMSLDVIAKTESSSNEKSLSKAEINAKLLAKSKDNATSQPDRNAINSYYFSKNVESIRHLLS